MTTIAGAAAIKNFPVKSLLCNRFYRWWMVELLKFKEYYLGLNLQTALKSLQVLRKNCRSFSTITLREKNTPSVKAFEGLLNQDPCPWFVTGFMDGEASFMIKILKSPRYRFGWSVQPVFQIKLHERDKELLISFQVYFGGVGTITRGGKSRWSRVVCLEMGG